MLNDLLDKLDDKFQSRQEADLIGIFSHKNVDVHIYESEILQKHISLWTEQTKVNIVKSGKYYIL